MLTFFRRQNGRAFFPPLPIAALLRRSWCRADSNGGAWDASVWFGWLCSAEKQACFSYTVGDAYTRPMPVGMFRRGFGYFCNTKGQRGFISTLAFIASRRSCRPTAVFPIQLARSYTRPASRGTCRATAVTPQPSSFPSSGPAPYGRGVGCRGTAPA